MQQQWFEHGVPSDDDVQEAHDLWAQAEETLSRVDKLAEVWPEHLREYYDLGNVLGKGKHLTQADFATLSPGVLSAFQCVDPKQE